MSTINIYEDLNSDMEEILKNDEVFLENCKWSSFNNEEWIIIIEDSHGNEIKMWDHQRDEFIWK